MSIENHQAEHVKQVEAGLFCQEPIGKRVVFASLPANAPIALPLWLFFFGGSIKSKIKCIFSWAVILCRIVLGFVVIKTGYDFAGGSGAFAYREADAITGIFVMIIGVYFVFSSFISGLLDRSE